MQIAKRISFPRLSVAQSRSAVSDRMDMTRGGEGCRQDWPTNLVQLKTWTRKSATQSDKVWMIWKGLDSVVYSLKVEEVRFQ